MQTRKPITRIWKFQEISSGVAQGPVRNVMIELIC